MSRYKLVGNVVPLPGPGFATPTFQLDSTNGLWVQDISSRDRIRRFLSVELPIDDYLPLSMNIERSKGEDAIYVFRGQQAVFVDTKSQLALPLRREFDTLVDRPFLQRSIGRFLSDNTLIEHATRNIDEKLRSVIANSHDSSKGWPWFASHVAAGKPSLPPLPLVHMTTVYGLQRILREGKLATRFDEFFNESLLFCSYGRPPYNKKEIEPNILAAAPVLVIFSGESLGEPRRIYPFDSGVYSTGMYGPATSEMELRDFEVPSNLDAPRRFIEELFGSNEAYIAGKPLASRRRGALNFEEEVYLSLFSKEINQPAAIEIQYDRSIDVQGNVRLAIVPEVLLESTEFIELADKYDIELIPYFQSNKFNLDYQGVIIESLVTYYREKAIL